MGQLLLPLNHGIPKLIYQNQPDAFVWKLVYVDQ